MLDDWHQPFQNGCGVLSFALPDCDGLPPPVSKCLAHGLIALNVAVEFPLPEIYIRARRRCPLAAIVTMPEAAMNEDCRLSSGKGKVRPALYRCWCDPVTQARSGGHLAHA